MRSRLKKLIPEGSYDVEMEDGLITVVVRPLAYSMLLLVDHQPVNAHKRRARLIRAIIEQHPDRLVDA